MPIVPAKTSVAFIAWQTIATANVVHSPVRDVREKWHATVYVEIGRASGSAFTTPPEIRVSLSHDYTGTRFKPVAVAPLQLGATIVNTTLNGAVSAAATSCVVTSASNIAAGDMLFLGHTTLAANYEIVRVKSVSGTTINFQEACLNDHDTLAQVTDQAELLVFNVPLLGAAALRVAIDNYAGGQSLYARADLEILDSY